MFSYQAEILARVRPAQTSRISEARVARRNSLQIILDVRRARRQSPAG